MMDDNTKLLNFTFPNGAIVDLIVEDKPINKTMFLPNHQPLICREHEFIYQPITKVACKTIKTWMLSLKVPDFVTKVGENNFGKDIEFSHMNDINFNIHDYSITMFGPIQYERESIIDGKRLLKFNAKDIKIVDNDNFEFADEFKDYFKFTFVRNPWTRILSAYLEKFRTPGGMQYSQAVTINQFFLKMISNKFAEYIGMYFYEDNILSFDGFIDILHQCSKNERDTGIQRYSNFDIHWMPQYIMNDMYIKEYDFIGKLENFEDDFHKILETLNIKIKPKYKIGSNPYMVQKHHKFYENNPELIDKVAEIYKEDIERYDYDFSDLENS